MATLGRKPNVVPTISWKVRLPINIAAKFDLHITDPLTGQPTFGERSKIVTGLIREYLISQGIDPN